MKNREHNFIKLKKLIGQLPPPFPNDKKSILKFLQNNPEIEIFESKTINEIFVNMASLNKFINKNL